MTAPAPSRTRAPSKGSGIRRLLVANRGEIAVRIIRAARDLGIETVLAHSAADTDSLAARMADRALCIGPAPARQSYLNIEAMVAAAVAADADAVHPGYGFLAEDPNFAARIEGQGLIFVGPTRAAIELMGNKIAARTLARRMGIPTIPGSAGVVAIADAREVATELGFPVILKAAGGGGGRGMRLVDSPSLLETLLGDAAAEAGAAFGDGSIYVEKYLDGARHVEVQVIADAAGDAISLGERDCTIQRRYQKLVEEAPSPAIDEGVRRQMGDAAVRLSTEVSYRGVGTVEFLYDGRSGEYYFLEMNTRLQVEHPVTEEITGLDLVELQLRIAGGERLPVRQEEVRFTRHAVEFRISAEDPRAGFRPSAGAIESWVVPQGPGVRIDSHCFPGYHVPPFYDSLLAKLIVSGRDRTAALARARRALAEFQVTGVATTIPFHRWLLEQESFISADVSTSWVERVWPAEAAACGDPLG